MNTTTTEYTEEVTTFLICRIFGERLEGYAECETLEFARKIKRQLEIEWEADFAIVKVTTKTTTTTTEEKMI